MFRTVATRLLLATALVVTIPTAATAQDEASTIEGRQWYLVGYDAGGAELTEVPWDLGATLLLDEGQAYGYAGCNGFDARYELDGDALSFGDPGTTDVGCPDRLLAVETAYMAALPKVARVAGDSSANSRDLILFDADDEHLLRFTSSDSALLWRQVRELTEQVEAQQKTIRNLRARIKELEQGG